MRCAGILQATTTFTPPLHALPARPRRNTLLHTYARLPPAAPFAILPLRARTRATRTLALQTQRIAPSRDLGVRACCRAHLHRATVLRVYAARTCRHCCCYCCAAPCRYLVVCRHHAPERRFARAAVFYDVPVTGHLHGAARPKGALTSLSTCSPALTLYHRLQHRPPPPSPHPPVRTRIIAWAAGGTWRGPADDDRRSAFKRHRRRRGAAFISKGLTLTSRNTLTCGSCRGHSGIYAPRYTVFPIPA